MKTSMLLAAILAVAWPASAQVAPPREGWVVLTVAEYRALRDKAFPSPAAPEAPPVAATISRVEYDLAVDGATATGQVRLVADVFQDGWIFIPVPVGLRVREATLDGRPVPLVTGGAALKNVGPSVLVSHAGRSTIVLAITVPVASRSGNESLSLPPANSPVQRATVSIRTADATLALTGGLVEQRTATAAPPATRFVVAGRPGEALTLSWHRQTPVVAPRALRIRGNLTELVGLGEDSAQVSAQVRVEVIEGAADRIGLRLPAGFSIGQVTGPLVGDWTLTTDNVLTVSLLEPVDRETTFSLTGETRTSREGAIDVPIIALAGGERESGGVAVEVLGAGEITAQAPRGLDPADATDLSPEIAARRSPALVAYRFRPLAAGTTRSLGVTIARYTPKAVLLANIDHARYRVLLTEDGKSLVDARFALRNSQRSFLGLTLPSNATLWTASVDGRPARPGRTPEGALLVPILKDHGDAAHSIVEVMYIQSGARWPNEGSVAVDLPILDLPISQTSLVVHHSPRYRLTLEAGAFRERADPGPEPDMFAVGAGATAPARLADEKGNEKASPETRDLLSAYQRTPRSGSVAGLLPITLPFPAIGPSRFLAAELTEDGKTPVARFTFKREVK